MLHLSSTTLWMQGTSTNGHAHRVHRGKYSAPMALKKNHKTYCCAAGLTCGGGECIDNPPCGSGETFCNDGGPSFYCCPHGYSCGGGICGSPPVTCNSQETYCNDDFDGGPPYCCPFERPICSFGNCSEMDACRNECNRDLRLGLKCSCQNPHCV